MSKTANLMGNFAFVLLIGGMIAAGCILGMDAQQRVNEQSVSPYCRINPDVCDMVPHGK